MCAIQQAVAESFFLVGGAQMAAEMEDGVVIAQVQGIQIVFKLPEPLTDFRRIGFVGFGIGLVELVEYSLRIAVPWIKGMAAHVGSQCFGNGLQNNTSKKVCVMLPWMGGNYKSFLKKYSVCARERIPEQGDLRRSEGEHGKQHAKEADGGEGELWGFAMAILFECPPLEEKSQCCGDVEDGNVDPIRGLSEHAIIGVEQHRDQGQPQQNLSQLDAPVVFLCPEIMPLNQRKEEQRPE